MKGDAFQARAIIPIVKEADARIADQHAVAAFKAGSGPHPSAYARMIAAAIRGEA